jgi:hypothetical protein
MITEVKRYAGSPAEPYEEPGRILCPCCHSADHVEKVSAVVRKNSGLVQVGGSFGILPYTSRLSQALAAPEAPGAMSLTQAIVTTAWALGFALFFYLIFEGLGAQDLVDIPSSAISEGQSVTLLWFVLAMPAIAFAYSFLTKKRAERKLPAWREASTRWHNMYYCSHDDVVFPSHGATYRVPESFDELLYSGEDDGKVEGTL